MSSNNALFLLTQPEPNWVKVGQTLLALGISCEVVQSRPRLSWDGRKLSVWYREPWLYHPVSHAFHEIAHWLVSRPTRRKRPEFGLGSAPDASVTLETTLTAEYVEEEEKKASALGIQLEWAWGLDYEDTIDEHGWDDDREQLNEYIRKTTAFYWEFWRNMQAQYPQINLSKATMCEVTHAKV